MLYFLTAHPFVRFGATVPDSLAHMIKILAYPRASRRVLDKEIVHIEKVRVADIYQNVIWLHRPWTKIIECKACDGCSYELTITYKDNRKKENEWRFRRRNCR